MVVLNFLKLELHTTRMENKQKQQKNMKKKKNSDFQHICFVEAARELLLLQARDSHYLLHIIATNYTVIIYLYIKTICCCQCCWAWKEIYSYDRRHRNETRTEQNACEWRQRDVSSSLQQSSAFSVNGYRIGYPQMCHVDASQCRVATKVATTEVRSGIWRTLL